MKTLLRRFVLPRIAPLLLLSVTGIAGVSILSITALDVMRQRRLHWQQLEVRGLLAARTAADVLADAVYTGDIERLRHQAGLFALQPEVHIWELFAADRRILVSSEQAKWATGMVDPEVVELLASRPSGIVQVVDERVEVLHPLQIGGQHLGGLRLVLDDTNTNRAIRAMLLEHLWQGLLMVALSAGLAYWLASYLTGPVRGLIAAVQRVGSGEDLHEVQPPETGSRSRPRHDELGDLTNAFHQMTERLRAAAEAQAAEQNRRLRDEVEQRSRAQDALEKANTELYRQLEWRERTELERERFIAELEARNSEMERFTYTVSHDLKSPLVTMSGFLGHLTKDLEKGDLQRSHHSLDRIRWAIATMQGLLDGLLDLSRAGRVVGPPTRVDLHDIVEAALRVHGAALQDREVDVVVSPELPIVYVDSDRLRDVFANLIGNAVKFLGGQTQPRIMVGVRQQGDEEVLFVADNGIGIDPRYHERVFSLFERLDPDIDGTGIGLALARRIIEQHGGRIWIESTGIGRGTTVCFTLAAPDATTAGIPRERLRAIVQREEGQPEEEWPDERSHART